MLVDTIKSGKHAGEKHCHVVRMSCWQDDTVLGCGFPSRAIAGKDERLKCCGFPESSLHDVIDLESR